MRYFTRLCQALVDARDSKAKVVALVQYFNQAVKQDILWALSLLLQRRPSRIVTIATLKEWAIDEDTTPQWLLEECMNIVGDLTETISLIMPRPTQKSEKTLSDWLQAIGQWKKGQKEDVRNAVQDAWKSLDQDERFVFNRLLTGGFRLKVDPQILVKALSQYTEIDEQNISLRLNGDWHAETTTFDELLLQADSSEDRSKPYDFLEMLALDVELNEIGKPADWIAEHKWDGIRGQLVLRQGECYFWSREGVLMTDKFPEMKVMQGEFEVNMVMDVVVLPFKEGKILDCGQLMNRIARKSVSKKQMAEIPIAIMAFDLLEYVGVDIRQKSLEERRRILQSVIQEDSTGLLMYSDQVDFSSWADLHEAWMQCRKHHTDGLILKSKDSTYGSGVIGGGWKKWKVAPLTIDAVLLYVQRGRGGRSGPITELTFAVWKGDDLVTFVKTKPELTEEEMDEIDQFAKANTKERFGPVSSLKAELIFRVAFDGISASSRHKSGVVVRGARVHSWLKEKGVEDVCTLKEVKGLLDIGG